MLIREGQLKAFESEADEAFYSRLAMSLRGKYADVAVRLPDGTTATVAELPLDLLRLIVRNGVGRARGYGLSWENNLAAFVSLMLDVAPNFDEHPLIRYHLRDDRVPPDARMDLVVRNISEETWRAAERNYDPAAWDIQNARGGPAAVLAGHAGSNTPDDDAAVTCPRCAAAVYVGAAGEGDVVMCDDCGTMMEVTSLRPFTLNLLDDESAAGDDEPNEEWKDEWDEEGEDDAGDDKYNWGGEPGGEDDDDDDADEDDPDDEGDDNERYTPHAPSR